MAGQGGWSGALPSLGIDSSCANIFVPDKWQSQVENEYSTYLLYYQYLWGGGGGVLQGGSDPISTFGHSDTLCHIIHAECPKCYRLLSDYPLAEEEEEVEDVPLTCDNAPSLEDYTLVEVCPSGMFPNKELNNTCFGSLNSA